MTIEQLRVEIEALGYRVWHDGKEWHASGPRELVSPFLPALLKAVRGL